MRKFEIESKKTQAARYVQKHRITERYQCNCCLGLEAGYGITIKPGQNKKDMKIKNRIFVICRG